MTSWRQHFRPGHPALGRTGGETAEVAVREMGSSARPAAESGELSSLAPDDLDWFRLSSVQESVFPAAELEQPILLCNGCGAELNRSGDCPQCGPVRKKPVRRLIPGGRRHVDSTDDAGSSTLSPRGKPARQIRRADDDARSRTPAKGGAASKASKPDSTRKKPPKPGKDSGRSSSERPKSPSNPGRVKSRQPDPEEAEFWDLMDENG
jgi:hypothetical protein